jgi:hypothetical protein
VWRCHVPLFGDDIADDVVVGRLDPSRVKLWPASDPRPVSSMDVSHEQALVRSQAFRSGVFWRYLWSARESQPTTCRVYTCSAAVNFARKMTFSDTYSPKRGPCFQGLR